ncbi:hypothetical protein GGF31_005692 [Allomyces arbusculus]|nr:hypothetical protein GGF31_005692 [Allomyces arbusculus]
MVQQPQHKPRDLVVTDPATGASCPIPAPNGVSKGQNGATHASFVVLPTNESARDTLTVLDNRTNKVYTIPITDGTVKATDFRQVQDTTGEGLRLFDAGFVNTAVARSKITEIDGAKGILRYRGYPIEQLSEKSTFLEVAYLLIYGELPSKNQFDDFEYEVMHHTYVHVKLAELEQSFQYDAHPMGMFIATMAAASTFDPSGNPALSGSDIYTKDKKLRNKQIFRILGKVTTIAAMAYRHRIGRPANPPQQGLSYTENFLYMMDHLSEPGFRPHPVLARALDVLFILHADHELNCSTAAMRHIGSSLVDPYSAVAGAAAALYGPLHGGANEAVVRMLESIGTVEKIPAFIESVKRREKKLMGFGHRIYTSYDPRATIIRKLAYDVFEVVGTEPLIEVAQALEQVALTDDYFTSRKLYPNVDFYSGLIYKAMGFPLDYFPVLFAIPRVAGWLAHWSEAMDEPNAKIWRPRQIYCGEARRDYVPIEHRAETDVRLTEMTKTASSTRRRISSWEGKKPGKL